MNVTTDEFIENNPPPIGWCTIDLELRYDAGRNRLTGRFEWIGSPDPYFPNISRCCPGTVTLHRLEILSPLNYCRGEDIRLEVTGENIKWYSDSTLNRLVARGNTFAPNISETTTYYITQSNLLTGIESPAHPIIVNIHAPEISSVVSTPSACNEAGGTIEI